MAKWWAGLRGDAIVLVYASVKPVYLTSVTKGYDKLNSLIKNSQVRDYPTYISFLKSSIRG
jgi:hypothetical protein